MPKNRGHVHREQIDAGAEGRAVLAHLMMRWRASEAAWRARLAAGEAANVGTLEPVYVRLPDAELPRSR